MVFINNTVCYMLGKIFTFKNEYKATPKVSKAEKECNKLV